MTCGHWLAVNCPSHFSCNKKRSRWGFLVGACPVTRPWDLSLSSTPDHWLVTVTDGVMVSDRKNACCSGVTMKSTLRGRGRPQASCTLEGIGFLWRGRKPTTNQVGVWGSLYKLPPVGSGAAKSLGACWVLQGSFPAVVLCKTVCIGCSQLQLINLAKR